MFYTNINRKGNNIYHTYIDKSGEVKTKVVKDFKPKLYIEDVNKKNRKYNSIDGKPLEEMVFKNIIDFEKSKYQYGDSVKLYGNRNVVQQYISENIDLDEQLKYWDKSKIKCAYIDIETTVSGPLTDDVIYGATERIYVISIYDDLDDILYIVMDDSVSENNKTFKKSQSEYADKIRLFKCTSEVELLQKFTKIIRKIKPQILTGWNCNGYDFPVIINSLDNKVEVGYSKKLSPIEKINIKIKQILNDKKEVTRTLKTYKIEGISILDYMDLYKKFNSEKQESYSLDYILRIEEVGSKLEHESEIPGHLLYRKYFDDAILYNITDVMEMVKLEKKKSFIELACLFAFYTSSNIDDVMGSVTPWHNYIYNNLYNKNILHPISNDVDIEEESEKDKIVGAYVKAVYMEKYENVLTYDFTGLYPNLIKCFNISNDTILYRPKKSALEYIEYYSNTSNIKNNPNMCTTGNGARYDRNKLGMMAEFVDGVLTQRDIYKKKKDMAKKPEMKQRWDLYQLALKILANSLYGCMSNKYFIFYDRDVAESITSTGQVVLKYMLEEVNNYLNRKFKTTDLQYCIAADTDSIMITLMDKIKDLDEFINLADGDIQHSVTRIVNNFCKKFNAMKNSTLEMKREMICDVAFYVKKKNYCMRVLNKEGDDLRDNPFYKIMGLEAKKKSKFSKYSRDLMIDAYKKVLDGKKDEFMDASIELYKKYKSTENINDIVERTSVKDIDKWSDGKDWFIKGTPYHVKAAYAYNRKIYALGLEEKYPPIKSGDQIKIACLKQNNPFLNDRIAWIDKPPKELNIEKHMDYEETFIKTFYKPVLRASQACGWEFNLDSIWQPTLDGIMDARQFRPKKETKAKIDVTESEQFKLI